MDDAAVPAQLVEQVEDLLETAARRGHHLTRPALELAAATDDRSQGIPGAGGAGRLVLATDVLTAAPAAQRWAIAHELAHLHPDATRPVAVPVASALVMAAAVAAAVVLTATSIGAVGGDLPWQVPAAAVLVVGLVGLVIRSLFALHVGRCHERRTDAVAARVFGQVLPADAVAWLVDVEGPRARRRPTPLRGHPRPARRRQVGLDALT